MRAITLLTTLTLLAACQPTVSYKRFISENVPDSERPVFGKIETTYRDIEFDRSCHVYFNHSNVVSYEIDPSGIFIGSLPVGENHITKLKCLIGPRTQWFFTNFNFDVSADTQATDIGVISFEMGDPDLKDSAITSWTGEIADTLLFSIPSQKLKDAHMLKINHRRLNETERKNFMVNYPELNKSNNGKFVSAISFNLDNVEKSGKLPKYNTRVNNR